MYQIYFILEWHSTCFGRSFRPSSGVQDCKYSLQASSQQYLFDKYLLLCVQSLTPDDGRKDRPKHVEYHSKIKYIWYAGASGWFYYRNNITMHDHMNVKLSYSFSLLSNPSWFSSRWNCTDITWSSSFIWSIYKKPTSIYRNIGA